MIALRVVVGAVFLGSGALKFAQPVATVLSIGAYDLLPAPLALYGALLLPGVEVAVGAALLAGAFERGAPLLGALVSMTFAIFVGVAWGRGLDVSCGCFGPLQIAERAGPATFALDLALSVISFVLFRCCVQRPR